MMTMAKCGSGGEAFDPGSTSHFSAVLIQLLHGLDYGFGTMQKHNLINTNTEKNVTLNNIGEYEIQFNKFNTKQLNIT